MPFKSKAQRRWMFATHPEMAKEWQEATPKGKKLPEKVKAAAFFDEFHKIAATVLMKKLAPEAKAFMERLTGATRGASLPQAASTRKLRQALVGRGAPELTTELTGLAGQQMGAKRMARQHFENVLQQQGRVYRGVPGLEQRLGQIGGHPGTITRTPARVVQPGTVAAGPSAKRALQPAAAQAQGTVAAGPAAKRALQPAAAPAVQGTVAGGPAAMRKLKRPNVSFGAPGGAFQPTAPTMLAPVPMG